MYLVYDNTESAMSSGQLAISTLKKLRPDIEGVSLNNMTYEEVFEAVSNAEPDSAIFIVSFYGDREGRTMSFEQLCHMISQQTKVPVFNLYDFTIGHGAIGGSMLSGRKQGEIAASIALRIMDGEPASSIPISDEKTVSAIYDYNQLSRFGIPIDRVDDNSEIINKPFSFFETYKTLVLIGVGVITILSALLVVLMIYVRRLKAAERQLRKATGDGSHIQELLRPRANSTSSMKK